MIDAPMVRPSALPLPWGGTDPSCEAFAGSFGACKGKGGGVGRASRLQDLNRAVFFLYFVCKSDFSLSVNKELLSNGIEGNEEEQLKGKVVYRQ